MRLKVITTALVLSALGLFLAWPLLIRHPGKAATEKELAYYGAWTLGMFGLISILALGAALCAILLARQQVKAYREEQARNLTELIHGSLKDHEKP